MEPTKARYAQKTERAPLADVMVGADVFLGLSTAGVLKRRWSGHGRQADHLRAGQPRRPEIMPELAGGAPDAIIATGRSDYPNQVNNVLCFPFIFRGALDVAATKITEEMKLACVRHRRAGEAETSDVVAQRLPRRRPALRPRTT